MPDIQKKIKEKTKEAVKSLESEMTNVEAPVVSIEQTQSTPTVSEQEKKNNELEEMQKKYNEIVAKVDELEREKINLLKQNDENKRYLDELTRLQSIENELQRNPNLKRKIELAEKVITGDIVEPPFDLNSEEIDEKDKELWRLKQDVETIKKNQQYYVQMIAEEKALKEIDDEIERISEKFFKDEPDEIKEELIERTLSLYVANETAGDKKSLDDVAKNVYQKHLNYKKSVESSYIEKKKEHSNIKTLKPGAHSENPVEKTFSSKTDEKGNWKSIGQRLREVSKIASQFLKDNLSSE